jgi:hypothetical protein
MTDVLEHIAEPRRLMREVARMLAVGGKVIIGVPFMYHLHEQLYDYYRFTEFALKTLLENSGLAVLQIEPYGGAPEVLFDLTAKTLSFLPDRISNALLKIHLLIARGTMSLNLMQRFSRLTSKDIPLGYCAIGEKQCKG